jgi:putative nucleotidyltransferase with HDIG domain
VAALALEMSYRLRLPPNENWVLERAALLHHFPPTLLAAVSCNRLLADLCGPEWPAAVSGCGLMETPGQPDVRAVLEALRKPKRGQVENKSSLFAQIVELADLFDEQIEYMPHGYRTVEQVLDELRWMTQDGFCHPAVVAALTSLPRTPKQQLLESVYRLPVFPASALQALALAAEEEVSFQELDRLAGSDQVLAGNLLKVANSVLFSPTHPVATIRQALSYIGLEAARKVLMAAVLEPLFGSAKLRSLWLHSLRMAQFCERIARETGRLNPDEAFLAGLVHDVGRLALSKLSGEAAAAYDRLIEKGCVPVYAELTLLRFDHAELGGDILRVWNFPDHLVGAVQHHHAPEQSEVELASLLYAAECWMGGDEDLPSSVRLAEAVKRAGLSIGRLSPPEPSAGLLDALICAA